MWYYIAAERGDTAALSNRDEFADKLSEEELQAAQDMARKWIEDFKGEALSAGRIE